MTVDNWSKLNEVVQNILALGVVGTYLYLVIVGATVPLALVGFTTAILLYFGFKAYKNGTNGNGSK
jgi:hypothetical protein